MAFAGAGPPVRIDAHNIGINKTLGQLVDINR